MVPKLKNHTPIVASPPALAPATLRDVLDQERDPRRRSALRRLETILAAPLASMPAEIDWFDAQFPRDGFGGPGMPWISERAYRHWRTTVRNAIRRHLESLIIAYAKACLLQSRHHSVTSAYDRSPTSANLSLAHTEIDRLVNRYADFRDTASDPKSD